MWHLFFSIDFLCLPWGLFKYTHTNTHTRMMLTCILTTTHTCISGRKTHQMLSMIIFGWWNFSWLLIIFSVSFPNSMSMHYFYIRKQIFSKQNMCVLCKIKSITQILVFLWSDWYFIPWLIIDLGSSVLLFF